MPPISEAKKLADKRYKSTEQGKRKQLEAITRYLETEPGQEALERTQQKYEQKPERKAAKLEWMREYRLRKKQELQQAAESNQE